MKNSGKNNNNQNEYKAYVYKRTLIAKAAECTPDYGLSYVGQAHNMGHRNSQWRDTNNPYSGPKIDRARKQYGPEDWTLEILFERSYKKKSTRKKKLDNMETYYIIKEDTVEHGFNSSYGKGMKGIRHTEEAKRKMSIAHQGKPKSEETKLKISKALKKSWRDRKRKAAKASVSKKTQAIN